MNKTLLAALLLAAPAAAQAQVQVQAQQVSVEHAWSRATAPRAMAGGVFLTLRGGAAPDRLLSASSPVAGIVELHRTVAENGIMRMLPVEALPIAPGQPIELKPGGLHIMLMELKHQLKQGESFPVTLTFEKSPPVTATVTIAGPGAAGPDAGMHAHPPAARP